MSATRSAAKRNRNVLPIETKLEIIERLEKGETQSSLAKVFKIGKATISGIKSRKDLIMKFASQFPSNDGTKKRKIMRYPEDEKLEEAMHLWFVQRRSQGQPITGPQVCEKARELNYKLGGLPDFKASTGWLKNFKCRHAIRELEVPGEALSNATSTSGIFVETFLTLLNNGGYSLDDVYNADETGLKWKSLPRKSLPSTREISVTGLSKANEERVTILVAANASGSHTLPLLMVGKSTNPRCFKNSTCLPLCYKAQRRAWMKSEIFYDWYATEFVPKVKKFREQERKTGKVLLLLDNAPSHPEVERLNAVNENFNVIYMPLNVTTLIQPMTQGIIKNLKMVYKKQVLRLLLLAEDEESVIEFSKKISLNSCCYMISNAWNTLPQYVLKKAWNKMLKVKEENEEPDTNINEIVDMFQAIPGFSECDKDDALEWLENDNDPGFQILNDDEIVSFLQEEHMAMNYDEDEEDGEGDEDSGPSHEEAFIALETAMSWYEQQEESCSIQLLLLKRMRELAAEKMQSDNVPNKLQNYFLNCK